MLQTLIFTYFKLACTFVRKSYTIGLRISTTMSPATLQRAGNTNTWTAAVRIFWGVNGLHLTEINKVFFHM